MFRSLLTLKCAKSLSASPSLACCNRSWCAHPTLLLPGTRTTRGSFTGSRPLKLKFIMLVWYQQGSIESHARISSTANFCSLPQCGCRTTRCLDDEQFLSLSLRPLACSFPPRCYFSPPVASGKYVAANCHPAFGGVRQSVRCASDFSLVCACRIAPSRNNPPVASGPDLTEKKGQKLCYLGFMRFIAVRARVQQVLLLMSLRIIRHACRHFTKRTQTRHPKCASTTWPRPGATWCVPTDTVSLSARA